MGLADGCGLGDAAGLMEASGLLEGTGLRLAWGLVLATGLADATAKHTGDLDFVSPSVVQNAISSFLLKWKRLNKKTTYCQRFRCVR